MDTAQSITHVREVLERIAEEDDVEGVDHVEVVQVALTDIEALLGGAL